MKISGFFSSTAALCAGLTIGYVAYDSVRKTYEYVSCLFRGQVVMIFARRELSNKFSETAVKQVTIEMHDECAIFMLAISVSYAVTKSAIFLSGISPTLTVPTLVASVAFPFINLR